MDRIPNARLKCLSICVACCALLCGLAATGCQPGGDPLATKTSSEATTVNAMRIMREENSSETAIYFGTLEPIRESQPRFAKPGTIKIIQPLGSRVASGDQLATLDQDVLEERKKDLEELLQPLKDVGTDQQRIAAYEGQLRDIEAQLDQGVIEAPWDCLIVERFLDEGSPASPQSPVLRIVETLPPRVVISLPRRVADRLRMDQQLWVVIGEQPVECKVDYRSIEEAPAGSKTVWLSMQSDMADIPWAFGQTVEVRFNLASSQSGFWLPLSALNRDASGLWSVYVVQAQETPPGSAAPADLKINRKIVNLVQLQNDWALVDGSLSDNELVVVNGAHRIVSGQSVQVNDVTREFVRPGDTGGGE